MKLYRTLASAIQDADNVEALKLDIKDGRFPPELFMLSHLKELYLEGNCVDVPKIGAPWPQLKTLSIKWPQFKGDLSKIIALATVENMKIIETPQKRMVLPIGASLPALKSLTIKNCGLEILPEEIIIFPELTELNLGQNDLSNLPAAFPALTKLKRLNLDQNQFSKFPDLIKTMTTLSHLSIDGNPFPEEEKNRIQRDFHIWL
jgi:Leucine-rich repeat (LRR) protein